MSTITMEANADHHKQDTVTIPNGYKQTDAGVIPEDWSVRRLRDCLRTRPAYGINAAAVPYDDNLPIYLRITDIDDDGRFVPNPRVSVGHPNARRYFLEEGDLLFARTGASVGKSYLYNRCDGPLVYAGFLIRVKTDLTVLDPRFLAYYVRSKKYWDWVGMMSARSGQPGINGQEYGSLEVPIPNPVEQRVIATALSDVDKLIHALDKLITKKRAIKQAAMQQLLTGSIRLPGFSGEWETRRLGELGSFSKGKGIKKDEVTSDGVPCVRYGEIYTHYSNFIKTFHSFIPRYVAAGSQRLRKGDLLFAGSGETSHEIGKCIAFLTNEEAYAGGDIVIFSPSGQDSMYLGYLMNFSSISVQMVRMGQGDAVVHISARNLATLEVLLPCDEEQTAIATVLSEMEAEIEALEARLSKTRDIKQGMLQELLTGRVRLITQEATA